MIMKYRKKLFRVLPFLLLLVFFVVQFFALRNHSQSFYFQDETEHVTLGWMISDYGKVLYKDLSTNHQPLPILVGAIFSKVIRFTTLFQLVERLRIGMLFFNFLVSLYLVFRFKWKGLLSVLFLQSVSYLFFGWYVLAESLVAPFVSIVVLNLLELFFDKKDKQKVVDGLVMAFSTFWLAFNLLPLWPFIAISSLVYLYKSSLKIRKIFLSSFLIFSLLMFTQFPILSWLEETFYHLIKYYLPYNNELGLGGFLQLFLLPLTGLLHFQSVVPRFLFVSTVLIFIFGFKLFKEKKKRVAFVLLFLLVLFLNTRVTDVRKVFYTGFHLYPFIAGFSAFLSFFVVSFLQKAGKKQFILTIFIILFLLIGNMSWAGEKKDKVSEHNIQYGEQQAFINALSILKIKEDRLLTGADGYGYINMVSQLPLAGRQNFYLDWAYRVPKLRGEFELMMKESPPEFIYFKRGSSDYYDQLGLNDNYINLVRADSSLTDLYILKDSAVKMSGDQWQRLEEQRFQIPDITN